jgi:hypothetical protein
MSAAEAVRLDFDDDPRYPATGKTEYLPHITGAA